MVLRILLSLIVLLLVAVVSLLIRVLKQQKLQSSDPSEVLWTRGRAGISRRSFIPNFVTGIAALYLFKTAARATTARNSDVPPGHSDKSKSDMPHSDHASARTQRADMPHSDHASTRADGSGNPPPQPRHSDKSVSDVPHSDSRTYARSDPPQPKHSDKGASDVPHSDSANV